MVRGLLQDKNVPGTSAGTRATAAPSPWLLGLLQDFWESWVNNSLPCQTSLEQHRERPGCLKLQGGEYGRSGKHTETVGTNWGELRVGPSGALSQTVPSLAGDMGCGRGQALPCAEGAEGAAGLSRRIFSKRKRPLGALWGILLQQQLQSPLHPATRRSLGVWGASQIRSTRESEHLTGPLGTPPRHQGEYTPGGPETTSKAPGSVRTGTSTYSLEDSECLNLWVQRLPWSGTEKSWVRPPESGCSQKHQQNWLGRFEASRLFFFFSPCFFLSNSFFFIVFLLTPSSSLPFFLVLLFLSLPLYLFFLLSFFFFNPHK